LSYPSIFHIEEIRDDDDQKFDIRRLRFTVDLKLDLAITEESAHDDEYLQNTIRYGYTEFARQLIDRLEDFV